MIQEEKKMQKILFFIFKKKERFFLLNVPQFLNVIISLVVLPILLFVLTPEMYGLWQYVLAFQNFALIFTLSQITSASKRGIAKELKGTFYFALIKRFKHALLPSVVFVFGGILLILRGDSIFGSLLFLSIFYLYIYNILIPSIAEYYIANEQFIRWSVWQVLSISFSVLVSGLIAYFTHSLLLFVISIIVYGTIVSITELFFLTRRERLWGAFRDKAYDESCYTYGIRSLPNDTFGAFSAKIVDIIIANAFGYRELAFFSVAQKIRNVLVNVLKNLGPLLYVDFTKKQEEWGLKNIKRFLAPSLIIGVGMGILSIVAANIYISNFLPDVYHASIFYVVIFACSIPFAIPLTLLYTFLESHLRYRAITFATVIPNIIKISLVCILGYLFGVVGMVIALSVHVFISFIFYLTAVYKKDAITRMTDRIKWMSWFSNY